MRGVHRRSSRTTCPSSGRISFVIARRTAFSDPGSMKIAVPRATPAQARESMAALPISCVAERAKELAEAVEPLLEQVRDRFVGAVARRDAGAARRDDRVDAADLPEHRLVHVLRIVPEDLALRHDVAGRLEQLDDRPSADVGFRRPRVADREHGAAHARHRRLPMVLYAHGLIIWRSRRSEVARSRVGDGVGVEARVVVRVADAFPPTPVASAFRRKTGYDPPMRRLLLVRWPWPRLAVVTARQAQPAAGSRKLEADDEPWVAATLKKMTLDDKVGQLLVSSFRSEYMSTDSREYDALVKSIHELQDWRLPRVRRDGAGAGRAARRALRDRDARPAARGRVAAQPAAGDRAVSAAQLRRLRDRRRLPPRRRDGVSAEHGVRRRRRRAAGVRGRAHHRRRVARDRHPGELRARRRRQQQPAQSRSSTRARTARIPRRSAASAAPTSAGCRPAA